MISKILKQLMAERDLKTAELARRVSIPQPTLHRIVTGTSPNPHISSLIPLAEFFNIELDQLKGLAPIARFEKQESSFAGWHKVPLISWEQAAHWQSLKNHLDLSDAQSTTLTDIELSPHTYALTMEDSSMAPQFPAGTTIILDPDKAPRDRSYAVVYLAKQERCVFRQILIDAQNHYIKPLSPDLEQFQMVLLNFDNGDRYCGMLVQAKRNYF